MSELIMPIASDPPFRVQDVGSNPWRRQHDAAEDQERQRKRRLEKSHGLSKDPAQKADRAHQVDLLA